MAECSCIIHFRYSRKYCNGCNFFATECVMLCPTLTKLPLEYSLFSCHKLTKYDFGVQFGTKRSQVQILSPRPNLSGFVKASPDFLFRIFGQTGHNRTFPFSDAKGKQPTIVDLCTLLSALVALSVKTSHGQM